MLKRPFDFILSLFAFVILSPVLLPIMLLLLLTGEHEVFYRQERMGRGGRPFHILKFATMLKDSPNLAGGDITGYGDPRILPFGRILRKTKINELPQILNILKGDMSIIGPRPLTPRVYDPFPEDYKQAIKPLRPGLSGIGSVAFRDEEELLRHADNHQEFYVTVIQPYKAALEVWYASNQSFRVDLMLIFLTAAAILKPGLQVEQYFANLPPRPDNLSKHMNGHS